MALAGTGDNFVSSFHVHGGTFHQFSVLAKQMGIECRFIKSEDPQAYADAVDERTKFVWIETISNPGNVIPDFEELAKVARENGLPLIVRLLILCFLILFTGLGSSHDSVLVEI